MNKLSDCIRDNAKRQFLYRYLRIALDFDAEELIWVMSRGVSAFAECF